MPTRLLAPLAEVRNERRDLTALARHEADDLLDPLGLRPLAESEPLDQTIEELDRRAGPSEDRVALSGVSGPELDQAALLEVAERGDDAAALLAEHACRLLRVDARPDASRLAARDEAAQEVGALGVERADDVLERSVHRAEAVAGIERRSLPDETLQLQVRENRLQDERTYVEAPGELVLADRELRAVVVREDLGEQALDRLPRGRIAVREALESGNVVGAREELAGRRRTVPPGPADLLRVRLEALGKIEVVDVADIRLVDAHPERDRGDDDVAARGHPPLLRRDTVLRAHAGVVGTSGKAGCREKRSNAKRGALKRDVDDGRAGRPLAEPVDQHLVALRRARGSGEQRQVGSVEARHDGVGLRDAEAGTDVGDDGGRRRCRQREDARGPDLACPRGELEVVRTEVVPPLRDAVRLVDCEERDRHLRELGEEALVVEPLRRHVEELQPPGAEALRDIAHLLGAEAGVEPGGIDALSYEGVDLILHERDQRRDDDGDSVEQQCRELVAKALAGPGREHSERRATVEQRVDDLLLPGAEVREPEPSGEHLARVVSFPYLTT